MTVRLRLVPIGDVQRFKDLLVANGHRTVLELLREAPAFSLDRPIDERALGRPCSEVLLTTVPWGQRPPDAPLFWPPGLAPPLLAAGVAGGGAPAASEAVAPVPASVRPDEAPAGVANRHPVKVTSREVVAIAYEQEIEKLASFLRSKLSVMVVCEKLIVPDLWKEIVRRAWLPGSDVSPGREARLEPVLLELPADKGGGPLGGPSPLEILRQIIKDLKDNQVLVIPNLDLLGGGQDRSMGREARELTEVIYGALDRLVLAFADPTLPIPEVLAGRFAVRAEVLGLPREVKGKGKGAPPVPIATALVQEDEAHLFGGLSPADLYKNIAGLNPIRFREAMAYAVQVAKDKGCSVDKPARVADLVHELRVFKAQASEQFVIPDVTFESIGGYESVKRTLQRAIELLSGAGRLPDERLRQELIPRGFLFHGPPGTGKTLFAKAVANQMNATIRVVSGPEVTDMYVGESERKVRAVFAQARRNAPSVIVFDEFDSIAAKRTGRDDGGSRAGNALVAQILTEMDGFRPDVPILVIGTTNRLELIDEALLRPSRFQAVHIGLPEVIARRHIAEIHARHFRVADHIGPDVLAEIANATAGMNGDEIRSVFRDACLGLYCENPPIPVDARRVGFLVGRVRARRDAQTASRTEPRPQAPGPGRRQPSPGLVQLTPAATPNGPGAASPSQAPQPPRPASSPTQTPPPSTTATETPP